MEDERQFNLTDAEVAYLLDSIEYMKCDDCREQCGKDRCLYLSVSSKLKATEARDE